MPGSNIFQKPNEDIFSDFILSDILSVWFVELDNSKNIKFSGSLLSVDL